MTDSARPAGRRHITLPDSLGDTGDQAATREDAHAALTEVVGEYAARIQGAETGEARAALLTAQQAVLARRRALAGADDQTVRTTLVQALEELARLRGQAPA